MSQYDVLNIFDVCSKLWKEVIAVAYVNKKFPEKITQLFMANANIFRSSFDMVLQYIFLNPSHNQTGLILFFVT